MGSESNSPTSSPSASPARSVTPSAKRSRDPEDEVYLDNIHENKRYLSEVMASSLNGLTVGDSLSDTLMESSSTSDNLFFLRDDMSLQYSPISEDSEDSRYSETPINSCSSQPESQPTSPVSPYRFQRPLSTFSYGTTTTTSSPPHVNTLAAATSSQPRQRGSDSEGRFPSSPSDICHSGDLRRTALLRSVHMRAQPPGQESLQSMETEERPCSFIKSLVDERGIQNEECSSFNILDGEFNGEKTGAVLNVNMRSQPPGQESLHSMETEERECSFLKSLVEKRESPIKECSTLSISDGENRGKSAGVSKLNMKEDEAADRMH